MCSLFSVAMQLRLPVVIGGPIREEPTNTKFNSGLAGREVLVESGLDIMVAAEWRGPVSKIVGCTPRCAEPHVAGRASRSNEETSHGRAYQVLRRSGCPQGHHFDRSL